jgi:hypothetical protein
MSNLTVLGFKFIGVNSIKQLFANTRSLHCPSVLKLQNVIAANFPLMLKMIFFMVNFIIFCLSNKRYITRFFNYFIVG